MGTICRFPCVAMAACVAPWPVPVAALAFVSPFLVSRLPSLAPRLALEPLALPLFLSPSPPQVKHPSGLSPLLGTPEPAFA